VTSSQHYTARFALPDEDATTRLGTALASAVSSILTAISERGLVVALSGELGAGKTSVVRAALRAFGVCGAIKSPSFALVEPYVVSSLNFYHFDFYRLADPAQFSFAGFRDMFGPGTVCLVEWPEKAGRNLPAADLRIAMQVVDEGRQAVLTAATELGATCLQRITAEMETHTS
jgi:tRNA threonylcarbamoyladenosine biosynthesis protein TsaE